MVDVFISYASEDRSRVQPLAKSLEEQGWSVFWDRTIPAGKTWRQVIGDALKNARSVIVAWSKTSVESRWVQEEAERGLKRDILIPILIDDVEPPLGFGTIQAADLISWEPTQSSAEFEKLIADISAILGPPPRHVKEVERVAENEHKRKQEEERRRKDEEHRKAEEDLQRLEKENRRIAEERQRFEEEQLRAELESKAKEEQKRKENEAKRKAEEEARRKEADEKADRARKAEAQGKAEAPLPEPKVTDQGEIEQPVTMGKEAVITEPPIDLTAAAEQAPQVETKPETPVTEAESPEPAREETVDDGSALQEGTRTVEPPIPLTYFSREEVKKTKQSSWYDWGTRRTLGIVFATLLVVIILIWLFNRDWYWHEMAAKANQGDVYAQYWLGSLYRSGLRESIPRDDAKAVEWLRKAAEQGYADAQYELGLMYAGGRGVPKDDTEAVKWFRNPAEQGWGNAQLQLGFMYAEGRGVSKDDTEAVKWFRKAAKQGYWDAQEALKKRGLTW